MVYNIHLNEAIETVEDWLNGNNKSAVFEAVKKLKNNENNEKQVLD